MTQASAEALLALADRVETAAGPDQELDEAICALLYPTYDLPMAVRCVPAHIQSIIPRYTASLDAAMTLAPKEWRVAEVGESRIYGVIDGQTGYTGGWSARLHWTRPDILHNLAYGRKTVSPALALSAAALRARAALATQSTGDEA